MRLSSARAAGLFFLAATSYGAIVINNPSGGPPAQQPFTLTGTTGTPVSTQLTATPTATYTWSATGGALPPGVLLSTSGLLSGTPTTPGTYSFTVQATDQSGASGSASFSMTVTAGVLTI